ncbi:MAG: response regulator [Dehalococcoidia bacterium]
MVRRNESQVNARARAPHSPARALLVIDQPLLAGVVEMALNHGAYTTRVASSTPEAVDALKEWQPHLAVVDMDVDDGEIAKWLDQTRTRPERIPVVALTRRGGTKLAAFDHGVDDILTVPFSPEELVARILAVMRRTYGEVGVFAPVLKVGELRSTFSTVLCGPAITSCTSRHWSKVSSTCSPRTPVAS